MVTTARTRRRTMWRALGDAATDRHRPVALITGAAGGLGDAFASALAERGWALTLVDLDPDRLRSLTDRLRADGTSVDECVIDLAAADGPARSVEAALDRWGRLDLVVPFAGIFVEPRARVGPALRSLLRSIDLWHPLTCAELALSRADALERACIVIMPLSDAGLSLRDPWPYARAKAELHARSVALARRWRHRSRLSIVRCVVYPTRTDFGVHSDAVIAAHLGPLPPEDADHSGLDALLSSAPTPDEVVVEILAGVADGRLWVCLDPRGRPRRTLARLEGELLAPIAGILPRPLRVALRIQPRYEPEDPTPTPTPPPRHDAVDPAAGQRAQQPTGAGSSTS